VTSNKGININMKQFVLEMIHWCCRNYKLQGMFCWRNFKITNRSAENNNN